MEGRAMGQLHNRVALITGAGRGIGRAIALAYAKEGARLALAARTRRGLEQTAQEAQALGASTCIVSADVCDPTQVEDMVRYTIEQFATIDILNRSTRDSYTRYHGNTDIARLHVLPVCQCCVA